MMMFAQCLVDDLLGLAQRDSVLRSLWAGEAGFDAAHIQFQHIGIHRFIAAGCSEKALGLSVGFHQCDLLCCTAGEFQVAQGFAVDGEDPAGSPVFRGHIRDGRAIGEW